MERKNCFLIIIICCQQLARWIMFCVLENDDHSICSRSGSTGRHTYSTLVSIAVTKMLGLIGVILTKLLLVNSQKRLGLWEIILPTYRTLTIALWLWIMKYKINSTFQNLNISQRNKTHNSISGEELCSKGFFKC